MNGLFQGHAGLLVITLIRKEVDHATVEIPPGTMHGRKG